MTLPRVTINGVALTSSQAEAVRIACNGLFQAMETQRGEGENAAAVTLSKVVAADVRSVVRLFMIKEITG